MDQKIKANCIDLDLQFVLFTHALTGIVNEPMIYEYMISLSLAHCFFHRPFFCQFYFPFSCLALFLSLPLC